MTLTAYDLAILLSFFDASFTTSCTSGSSFAASITGLTAFTVAAVSTFSISATAGILRYDLAILLTGSASTAFSTQLAGSQRAVHTQQGQQVPVLTQAGEQVSN